MKDFYNKNLWKQEADQEFLPLKMKELNALGSKNIPLCIAWQLLCTPPI